MGCDSVGAAGRLCRGRVSEIIEKAAPVPDNSAQDYSDVPVYYEPFSYAKENDEVDAVYSQNAPIDYQMNDKAKMKHF